MMAKNISRLVPALEKSLLASIEVDAAMGAAPPARTAAARQAARALAESIAQGLAKACDGGDDAILAESLDVCAPGRTPLFKRELGLASCARAAARRPDRRRRCRE